MWGRSAGLVRAWDEGLHLRAAGNFAAALRKFRSAREDALRASAVEGVDPGVRKLLVEAGRALGREEEVTLWLR